MPRRRPVEAPREATCAFADAVARACLGALGPEARAEVVGPGRQGVLAGFVLAAPGGSPPTAGSPDTPGAKRSREALSPPLFGATKDPAPMRAVALGTGTKFLPNALLSGPGAAAGRLVRDCHAEVLARRALKRFLLREIRCACPGGGGSDVLELSPSEPGRFRLRESLSLHFYSSSQPCGNASLKRWAKGGGVPARPDLGLEEWPSGAHERLHVTARAEGQVALLVKRDGGAATVEQAPGEEIKSLPSPPEDGDGPAATNASGDIGDRVGEGGGRRPENPRGRQSTDRDRDGSARVSCGRGGVVPPGAVPLDQTPLLGQTMTCSDKMARWNALGVQGGLLAQLLDAPLRLATVTVGRKFSRRHLERALCCRLQDFRPENPRMGGLPPGYGIHHPAMMCASVRLDESTMEAGSAPGGGWAQFDPAAPSLAWALGDEAPDRIDGLTGESLTQAGGVSTVAKVTLFALFRAAAEAASGSPPPAGQSYRAAKDRSADYAAARALLLGDSRLFGGWLRADPALEAFPAPS